MGLKIPRVNPRTGSSPVGGTIASVLIGLEIVGSNLKSRTLNRLKVDYLLRLGVAYCYSFSRLYQNFRRGKWQYVGYLDGADAVVMDFELLNVYAVYLLGLIHFYVVHKLT